MGRSPCLVPDKLALSTSVVDVSTLAAVHPSVVLKVIAVTALTESRPAMSAAMLPVEHAEEAVVPDEPAEM